MNDYRGGNGLDGNGLQMYANNNYSQPSNRGSNSHGSGPGVYRYQSGSNPYHQQINDYNSRHGGGGNHGNGGGYNGGSGNNGGGGYSGRYDNSYGAPQNYNGGGNSGSNYVRYHHGSAQQKLSSNKQLNHIVRHQIGGAGNNILYSYKGSGGGHSGLPKPSKIKQSSRHHGGNHGGGGSSRPSGPLLQPMKMY